MAEPLLQITDLSHGYGDHRVLEGVSMSVEAGELSAILGASGVGKTTLLRSVAGFVTPEAGTITLGGAAMVTEGRELIAPEARGVGMVFQDHALFPYMTLADNVGFGLHGWEADARRARVAELLALVGLADRADALPQTLSGGQRQRIALARSLAPRPGILLLDEPFASLDAELRRALSDELREILRREEVAALMVTHDHRAALAWCDRVAVLGATEADGPGRLQQHDTPEAVYRRPATETVARLTGEIVALEGTATGDTAHNALGQFPLVAPHQGAVRLLLRPEQLRFTADDEGDAKVTRRRFEGAVVRLVVQSPMGVLDIEVASSVAPEVGATGTVGVTGAAWAIASGRA